MDDIVKPSLTLPKFLGGGGYKATLADLDTPVKPEYDRGRGFN